MLKWCGCGVWFGITAERSLALMPAGLKLAGVKAFTFAEVSDATNNFDKSAELGRGGYGNVYKGLLDDGTLVAVKRAERSSIQDSRQFYTEIELLSRVHHRNLVSLIGFCNDQGEQVSYLGFLEGRVHYKRWSIVVVGSNEPPLWFFLSLSLSIRTCCCALNPCGHSSAFATTKASRWATWDF